MQEHLKWFGEDFLNQIIVINEAWIQDFKPELKSQSNILKLRTSPQPKNFVTHSLRLGQCVAIFFQSICRWFRRRSRSHWNKWGCVHVLCCDFFLHISLWRVENLSVMCVNVLSRIDFEHLNTSYGGLLHRLGIYKPSVYRCETQAIYIFDIKTSNMQGSPPGSAVIGLQTLLTCCPIPNKLWYLLKGRILAFFI